MELPPLFTLFADLAIALFIGALVGVERERRGHSSSEHLLGVRTFSLVALAGATLAQLDEIGHPWLFEAGLVTIGLMATLARFMPPKENGGGLTTEIAAVLVYALGGVVILEGRELAVALGVVTAGLLAIKDPAHHAIERIGEEDVYAALKLLFATFIVLPVLPQEAVDPWGVIRPYSVWLLVILIAGLSMLGYVGARLFGEGRGLVLTGLLGGLVSSTAVTLELSQRSKQSPGRGRLIGAGILLAWSTMAARMAIEVALVAPAVLPRLLPPLVALLGAGAVAGLLSWRRTPGELADVSVSNPFRITQAMKIAALFAAVMVLVRLTQLYLPPSGIYAVSALAGLTDVDAITLSLAQEASAETLTTEVAARAILLAAVANTLAKWGMALWLGDATLRRVLTGATLAMLAAAGLTVALTL